MLASVAKLRSMPLDADDEAKRITAEAVPETTKATLSEMAKLSATPEMKRELVDQVKKARDGTTPEYFEAVDAVTDLVEKVKLSAPAPVAIQSIQEAETIDQSGPKDLLEAAKAMCAALKNLNLKLDTV